MWWSIIISEPNRNSIDSSYVWLGGFSLSPLSFLEKPTGFLFFFTLTGSSHPGLQVFMFKFQDSQEKEMAPK